MHRLLVGIAQQQPRAGIQRKRFERHAFELPQKIPRKLPVGSKDSWSPHAQSGRTRSGAAQPLMAGLHTMVYISRACHNKHRSPGAAGIAILTAVIACTTVRQASGATAAATRVRSTDAGILALVREGTERSATFNALVDTIGRSNGIVYIEFGYCAFGHLNGCLLSYIAPAHGDRYLRIVV